jgi:PadR family transcriptional regulator, regulatory protein PadR
MKSHKESEIAPLGSLEEHVMLAVLRTAPEAYGMNVRRELERVTNRSVTIGSVYITLDRLEAKGLVSSARSTVPGIAAPRRVFDVTKAGARALSETRRMRESLWAGIALPART